MVSYTGSLLLLVSTLFEQDPTADPCGPSLCPIIDIAERPGTENPVLLGEFDFSSIPSRVFISM